MDNTELLHNFIDDGLSPNDEEKLFSALADNSSLRTEFKNFIEFEKAAKSDIAAFVPPVESTAGIFSTLGIATTTAVSTGALIQSGFWAKYGSLLLTNFLAVAVTGIISYFIFTDYFGDSIKSGENNNISKKSKIEKIVQSNQNPIPVVSNLEELQAKDEQISVLQKSVHNLTRKISVLENSDINEEPTVSENSENLNTSENNSSNQDFTEIIQRNTNSSNLLKSNPVQVIQNPYFSNNSISFPSVKYYNPIQFGLFELHDFSIMMSGSEYKSYPNPTVSESSSPFLKDGNLVLMYDFSNQLSIGLDLRQEFFFQSYTGLAKDESKYLYEQNTNYTSFGLIAKYNFLDTKYFTPFGQIYLGGNKVGLIARALLGLEINPMQDYGFILGLECSGLRYQHNQKAFYSKKLGVYYGVIFHF